MPRIDLSGRGIRKNRFGRRLAKDVVVGNALKRALRRALQAKGTLRGKGGDMAFAFSKQARRRRLEGWVCGGAVAERVDDEPLYAAARAG